MEFMKVSIIACTYNRAPLIDKLLRSLVAQEFEGEHEIVVVDNNSTDDTKTIVENWIPRANPNCPIRYLFVARQGVSFARNAGVEAATGDVVAFIDDDAVAEKDWLQRVIDDMRDQSLACVGGKVIPAWAEPPPDWITFELLPSIGGSILGDNRCVMTGKLYPLGGNMAVRKSWHQSLGGFNINMGRVGKSLATAAEIEFADRLRRAGGVTLYDPQMIIHHHVPPSRMTQEYFLRVRYWEGRSVAVWQRLRKGRLHQWLMGIARILVAVPRDAAHILINSTMGKRSLVFSYQCRLRRTRGYVDEMWEELTAK
jgi:glycosyltransferase involved in cell wall biosynthesis